MYDLVLKYGTWMKSTYAIAPKEVVAIDFMNSPHFIFFWLALWSLGARPAFLNYNLTGQSLLHCIKTSTARIVFVDGKTRAQFLPDILTAVASPTFRDGIGPTQVVFFDEALEQQIHATQGVREPNSSRAGATAVEMAILIFTSGTTGLPKAAIVSWNKATVGSTFVSTWLSMKQKDRLYTVGFLLACYISITVCGVNYICTALTDLQCMPLYHASAALLGFCSCLINGCTFIIGHKFSTRNFWPEVRASNATIIQYVGETCRYLLAAPPQLDPTTGEDLDGKNTVRVAFGNGLRPDVWNRFKERFGIDTVAEFYAATEGPQGTWNISSNDFSRGAIGRNGFLSRCYLNTQYVIVKLDWVLELPLRSPENNNFCTKVSPGSPGELLCKVDAAQIDKKFQGYFNNAKATNGKVLRDVFAKGDAWFRTGDVVRWDSEGRWYFCDRVGDTFRWKAENISTAEVSEALGTHPAVQEANVYGVEIPHHEGRAGCAAMVLDRDASQTLLDGVATHAKERLPRYAVPLFLRIMSEIQATGNNKQQKHVLRAQGVEPGKVRGAGDRMFWLREGTYVEFEDRDWEQLQMERLQL